MIKKWLKHILLAFLSLTVISLILSIWLPFLQSMRVIFGAVYLLFLPGFAWSWVFWKKDELEVIERFTLSLALSIAIVPLVVFLLSKAGLKINILNSFLETFGLIIVGFLVVTVKKHNEP